MEIGRGAQYSVIDLQNGRVRKEPLSAAESHKVIQGWHPRGDIPVRLLETDYYDLALASAQKIQALILQFPELAVTFGNPEFAELGGYTQDKVKPLGVALQNMSLAKGRQLIDQYVTLIITHWRYGIAEGVFNSTINNGLDNNGNIILMDFGELTRSKQEAEASIRSRPWMKQASSHNADMPAALRGYYEDTMNRNITSEALDKNWQTLLDSTTTDPTTMVIDSALTLQSATKQNAIHLCPESILANLAMIDVEYYSFDQRLHRGQIIAHKDLVDDIAGAFELMLSQKFPIQSVIPIASERYSWDDTRSMEDNNSSAYNYRYIRDTHVMSHHATGRAIDINPLLNPYFPGDKVSPAHAVYDVTVPGTILAQSSLVHYFTDLGWTWGGDWDWDEDPDYQHFEKPA